MSKNNGADSLEVRMTPDDLAERAMKHDGVTNALQADFESETNESWSLKRMNNGGKRGIKTGDTDDDGDGLPLAAKR